MTDKLKSRSQIKRVLIQDEATVIAEIERLRKRLTRAEEIISDLVDEVCVCDRQHGYTCSNCEALEFLASDRMIGLDELKRELDL